MTPETHPSPTEQSRAAVQTEAREGVVRIIGEWRDRIEYADGRVELTEWKRNQVQNKNAELLAALMKNQAGISGILYFAIGSGQAAWDSSPPAQPFSDTTLNTEVFRKAVPTSAITFRNPGTGADQDPTPSNVIQVDLTFTTGEANFTHREFGLFGGDATATLDSGWMVNWVVHSRIDKDSSMSITRSVRFTFAVS